MSTNVTGAFTKQWADDVKHAFQQKGTKLLNVVRNAKNVVGSTYDFHYFGTATATTKTRDGDVTPLNPTSTTVTATLADYYASIYHDKLDELKTNIDLKKEYIFITSNAIGRKVDNVIVAAADLATNTLTTTAGGLTFAKLQELITAFNSADVDPEDRVLVIGAQQMTEALGITQLTSADYVAMQAIQHAGVGSALGMKWVMSTRLPIATTNRTCFGINKQALGVAIGKEITTETNYVPQKVAYLVNAMVSLGAVIIDQAGIYKMTCAE